MNNLRLKHTYGYITVKQSDIIMIEGEKNYSLIFTKNKVILTTKTLKKYEHELLNPCFKRIHKSHIVNINHVKESFLNNKSVLLKMSNGKTVTVSRRKLKEFEGDTTQIISKK